MPTEIKTERDKKPKEKFKGIEEIALCFSGGGYRAACFSLGTLSFFEKIGLLKKVKVISTVSGGTITGVKYAQSQAAKQDFDTFFKDYFNWLKKDELASNAIRHIKKRKIWKRSENIHKRKNPINAFAIEYNSFTRQMTLGDVQNAIENNDTHLERVVFNTTDFTHSMRFRFQNTNTRGLLGNKKIQDLGHDLKAYLNKLKLGDILASSSAFPGGFEPIGFPNDFVSKAVREKMGMAEIGLMDGGIIDNQGISSILSSSKKYDLYFLNDVASPYPGEPFKFAQSNSIIKILSYMTSLPLLFLTLSLTIYFIFQKYFILTALFVLLVTIMAAFQYLFYFANKMLKKEMGVLDKLRIPPRRFGYYVFDRITSLLKMTTEVFLKSARRSNYESIYSKFWNRIATSAIYELRCQNKENKPEGQNQWELIKETTGEITENMKKVAKYAASLGTTLWFSEEERKRGMLDAVVACGEFTACYNLIAHLITNHKEDIREGGMLYNMFFKALGVWKSMLNDPYYILAGRIDSTRILRI
ncbi:patatin-like phospholipase family protein [Poritiphilus flavus]|uniref:PNPLA domain-containing protein n=1 Tax=Poritiphilus flavus TaxID=2697053 RepID=A0A6L9EHY3_9FLAO|nr:patatin-like phospholipase family protein [Poritiphilus flavus]NAS14341.1 hypothetical protein [Poritiphilus flavus]